MHSSARRKEIFSLTHLGGHDVNWSNISTICLSQLTRLNGELAAYNERAMLFSAQPPISSAVIANSANGSLSLQLSVTVHDAKLN